MTLGAMMGYSDGPEPRGYWLRVRRYKQEAGFQTFALGDGRKAFLKEAKRFSEKELIALTVTPEQEAKITAHYQADIA